MPLLTFLMFPLTAFTIMWAISNHSKWDDHVKGMLIGGYIIYVFILLYNILARQLAQ